METTSGERRNVVDFVAVPRQNSVRVHKERLLTVEVGRDLGLGVWESLLSSRRTLRKAPKTV
jgi:hypothetical protein